MAVMTLFIPPVLPARGMAARLRRLVRPVLDAEGTHRAVDISGAVLGMLLCWPILLACAGWIKWCDGGPVLYRQWRVGRQGWLFPIYKLRTMGVDAETPGQARFATAGDPRVLPGCGWMRKCHVDELPQLWNILKGQMTLVGPRPERPEVFATLGREIPGFTRRLATAPGLTGLAQLCQGYSNDLSGMRRKLAFDLRYLRRRSLGMDLGLIGRTLWHLWDRSAL